MVNLGQTFGIVWKISPYVSYFISMFVIVLHMYFKHSVTPLEQLSLAEFRDE